MDFLKTVSIQCPHCGEIIEVVVDCSEPRQDYIEDCEVCCKPIAISVRTEGGGPPQVMVRREDD